MSRLVMIPLSCWLVLCLLLSDHWANMASVQHRTYEYRPSHNGDLDQQAISRIIEDARRPTGKNSTESLYVVEANSPGKHSARVSDSDLAEILKQKALNERLKNSYASKTSGDMHMAESLKKSIDHKIEINEAESDKKIAEKLAQDLTHSLTKEETDDSGSKDPVNKIVDDLAEAEVSDLETQQPNSQGEASQPETPYTNKGDYDEKMSKLIAAMLAKQDNITHGHTADETGSSAQGDAAKLDEGQEAQQVIHRIDEAIEKVVPGEQQNEITAKQTDEGMADSIRSLLEAEQSGNKKTIHGKAEEVLEEVEEVVPAIAEQDDQGPDGDHEEIMDSQLAQALAAALPVQGFRLKDIQENDIANDKSLITTIIQYLYDAVDAIKKTEHRLERKEQDILSYIVNAGIRQLEENAQDGSWSGAETSENSVTDLEKARLIESLINKVNNIETIVKSPSYETPQEQTQDIIKAVVEAIEEQLDPDKRHELQEGPTKFPEDKLKNLISIMLWKSQLKNSGIETEAKNALGLAIESLSKVLPRYRIQNTNAQNAEENTHEDEEEGMEMTTPVHKLTREEIERIDEEILNKTTMIKEQLRKKHEEAEALKKLENANRGPYFIKSWSPNEEDPNEPTSPTNNQTPEDTMGKAKSDEGSVGGQDNVEAGTHSDRNYMPSEGNSHHGSNEDVPHVNPIITQHPVIAQQAQKTKEAVHEVLAALEASRHSDRDGAPVRPVVGDTTRPSPGTAHRGYAPGRYDYDYDNAAGYEDSGYDDREGSYGRQRGRPGIEVPQGRPGYRHRVGDREYERRRAQDAIMSYLQYVRRNMQGGCQENTDYRSCYDNSNDGRGDEKEETDITCLLDAMCIRDKVENCMGVGAILDLFHKFLELEDIRIQNERRPLPPRRRPHWRDYDDYGRDWDYAGYDQPRRDDYRGAGRRRDEYDDGYRQGGRGHARGNRPYDDGGGGSGSGDRRGYRPDDDYQAPRGQPRSSDGNGAGNGGDWNDRTGTGSGDHGGGYMGGGDGNGGYGNSQNAYGNNNNNNNYDDRRDNNYGDNHGNNNNNNNHDNNGNNDNNYGNYRNNNQGNNNYGNNNQPSNSNSNSNDNSNGNTNNANTNNNNNNDNNNVAAEGTPGTVVQAR